MSESSALQRWFAGRAVTAVFSLLVFPVVLLKYGYHNPLALPGYLVLTIGSAIGNRIAPQFELWVYWGPFVVGSYALSVVFGGLYRALRSGLGAD
ncbi:hypothetical protein [Haloarchaeobius sp. HME9146]|uniref:hypothetical protein n=1 Tax=Haloarchaeobius sp. HME9146 TaxID=2978732 RepID=UPI0021BF914D|nr:hypothetical protein [Haloarchaeobius sp. HME9146]MCT9096267.1 hypothetical protein [Haloarchaeobius sp. HME9146]